MELCECICSSLLQLSIWYRKQHMASLSSVLMNKESSTILICLVLGHSCAGGCWPQYPLKREFLSPPHSNSSITTSRGCWHHSTSGTLHTNHLSVTRLYLKNILCPPRFPNADIPHLHHAETITTSSPTTFRQSKDTAMCPKDTPPVNHLRPKQ